MSLDDVVTTSPKDSAWPLVAARLEAKLDVALAQHGAQLQEHERRIGEQRAISVEHEQRITANALTIAETRSQTLTVAGDVKALEAKVEADQSASRGLVPVWIGIAIGGAGMVIGPILTVLLSK